MSFKKIPSAVSLSFLHLDLYNHVLQLQSLSGSLLTEN